MSCSPFLARVIHAQPSLAADVQVNLRQAFDRQNMLDWLSVQAVADECALKQRLRHLRMAVLCRLIVRDLNGLADLSEVMQTTSILAEVCLQFAVEWLQPRLWEVHGRPCAMRPGQGQAEEQSLIVVGMGKLGGMELNVSSDIDLIFAYEEEGETRGPQVISNQEFFTRLCKKLIVVMDEVTADGFVFRVDMRLRPFGSEGTLVSSLDALETYYQLYGREWERYAWIKGRVIIGPEQKLQSLLRPFVFRKYLDFSVIANLRQLKEQIQLDVNRRDLHENIKLGRGGIREIEFIAQLFQLIRGGKDPQLQIRATLEVLQLLVDKQILDAGIVDGLQQAYVFLRNLEHRLQYYEDAQTHDLPRHPDARAVIAKAMRMADWDCLYAEIQRHCSQVAEVFNTVFSYQKQLETPRSGDEVLWQSLRNDAETLVALQQQGFKQPQLALEKLLQLKHSHRVQHLPEMSQMRLNMVMPMLVSNCGKHYNASDTLVRALGLIETICRRASYLAFFAEYPNVLERLIDLLSASPWLASYITQHPILLDNLSTTVSYEDIDFSAQKRYLLERLAMFQGDTEQQMNFLRESHQRILFKIACEDVINNIPLTRVSNLLSELADIILQVVIEVVWQALPYKHREQPLFAMIAYGKYGSRELGYSSDLDLVFLYEDAHPEARDIYAKFGARLISWLNTFTSSGILYEIDTQLRPDGNSGLLVSSVEGFSTYQFEKAWVWEHQALTRARFAAGDMAIGQSFEQIRQQILSQSRDYNTLAEDITRMRQRMKDAHPYVQGQFDLKHSLGGMIDVEFIAQFLMMIYARQHPVLLQTWGTAETIYLSVELELIDADLGNQVSESYYFYRSQQHAMRLQGYSDTWVPEDSVQTHVAAVRRLWRDVFSKQVAG